MMRRIRVDEPPNYALVLHVMFPSLPLEKLDAPLAQRDGYFDSFIPKDEFLPGAEGSQGRP